ncbi:MAG: FAD-binding protein, partial [Pseudomonadota bacterium]
LRGLLGTEGAPTIGGVVATNASGPRRIQAGACRDSLIGVEFVNGRGEHLKSGGRVMKNVTGYDLVKLLCGSHGTLGILTEVALKVLPTPEMTETFALDGLSETEAVAAMAAALGTPFEVTGAAHLPAGPDGAPATLLRIEGFAPQIARRRAGLTGALAPYGALRTVAEDPWPAIRDVAAFHGRRGAVWRLSVKPSAAPEVVARIRATRTVEAVYDWGGGLVWLLMPEDADAGAATIRAAATPGHATLVRASDATRAAVHAFHPEPAPVAALSAALRQKFDPRGLLNPGRMA